VDAWNSIEARKRLSGFDVREARPKARGTFARYCGRSAI
jgi:hypothetical protein